MLVDQRQPTTAMPLDHSGFRQRDELLDVDDLETIEVEFTAIRGTHGGVALDQQAVVDQGLGEGTGLFVLTGKLATELQRLLHHVGGLAIDEQRLAFVTALDHARALFVDAQQEIIVRAGVDEDEGVATQVGRDIGLVFPQAILDEQVLVGYANGSHRHCGRASEEDREVVQRQRELAEHQRNGVVARGKLEPARQDAQVGVHIGLQRHRTGVEQGALLGAASVVVSLVVVILGTVRSCAPAIPGAPAGTT